MRILDVLVPEPGSIYMLDRDYIDFARLFRLHHARATFVVRAKWNLKFRLLYSHPIDRSTGLICDQTVMLTHETSVEAYPDKLRRVRFRDPETGKAVVLLTNNFTLAALTVTDLYRLRWHIELFFKWIKQHLRIKRFSGRRMPCASRSGSRSARMCSWPSCGSDSKSSAISTLCYRS